MSFLRLRLADRPEYHALTSILLSCHLPIVYFILFPLLTPICIAQISFTHKVVPCYFLYLLSCPENRTRRFSRLRGFRSLLLVGF